MIYKETQRMREHWWIFVLMGVTTLVALATVIKQWDEGSESIEGVIITSVAVALSIALLISLRLEIEVKNQALYYRFIPFIWSWRKIRASDVKTFQFKKLDALSEFGGYGYRWRPSSGPGYIITGDHAIYLEYGSKPKRLTLSIKNSKFREAFEQMMKRENRHG